MKNSDVDVRDGFSMIVDDNRDKMWLGSNSVAEDNKEFKKLQYHKDDKVEGVKVYLDAIGIFLHF